MNHKISKRISGCFCGIGVLLLCLLAGCGAKRDALAKIKDLEFTVLAEENIPKELREVIEGKRKESFKITYQDNGFLYICVGYGEQVSGGYSIAVNELYLTDNAIYIDTTLLGPEPGSEAVRVKTPSYPNIVVKTEFIDKPVVFN